MAPEVEAAGLPEDEVLRAPLAPKQVQPGAVIPAVAAIALLPVAFLLEVIEEEGEEEPEVVLPRFLAQAQRGWTVVYRLRVP